MSALWKGVIARTTEIGRHDSYEFRCGKDGDSSALIYPGSLGHGAGTIVGLKTAPGQVVLLHRLMVVARTNAARPWHQQVCRTAEVDRMDDVGLDG